MDPSKVLSYWEKGVINKGEFQALLIEILATHSVEELLPRLEDSMIEFLRTYAQDMPWSDVEWSKIIYVRDYCSLKPSNGVEEKKRLVNQTRIAVKKLRDYWGIIQN